MDEPFTLPVTYKNTIEEFEAQLFTSTYSYRIQVLVNEVVINFEKDDSGDFRALAASPDDKRIQHIDPALLQAIADAIEQILS